MPFDIVPPKDLPPASAPNIITTTNKPTKNSTLIPVSSRVRLMFIHIGITVELSGKRRLARLLLRKRRDRQSASGGVICYVAT